MKPITATSIGMLTIGGGLYGFWKLLGFAGRAAAYVCGGSCGKPEISSPPCELIGVLTLGLFAGFAAISLLLGSEIQDEASAKIQEIITERQKRQTPSEMRGAVDTPKGEQ